VPDDVAATATPPILNAAIATTTPIRTRRERTTAGMDIDLLMDQTTPGRDSHARRNRADPRALPRHPRRTPTICCSPTEIRIPYRGVVALTGGIVIPLGPLSNGGVVVVTRRDVTPGRDDTPGVDVTLVDRVIPIGAAG
jgi:hypothetical protein